MTETMPDLEELIGNLEQYPAAPVATLVLLAVMGLVYLLLGWRFYRFVLVLTLVLVGGALGAAVADHFGIHPLWLALPLGVAAGLLVVWIERIGAFVLGGLAGAVPVIASQTYFSSATTFNLAVIAAFLIMGSFTVLFLQPMIVLGTSVIGAATIEHVGLLLVARIRPELAYRIVTQFPAVVVGVFFAMVVIGILCQTRTLPEDRGRPQGDRDRAQRKKAKPAKTSTDRKTKRS